MSLDEGHGPRRKEQTGRQMGVGIDRFSPYAFGQRHRYDLRELVTYRPGPSHEGFAVLNRLNETLTPSRKFDERALFHNQPMSEQTQRLDRGDAGIALPQRFAQDLAALLVAIKEHVLLSGKVVEHRHPSDVGGCRDLVHRHMIKAPLGE